MAPADHPTQLEKATYKRVRELRESLREVLRELREVLPGRITEFLRVFS